MGVCCSLAKCRVGVTQAKLTEMKRVYQQHTAVKLPVSTDFQTVTSEEVALGEQQLTNVDVHLYNSVAAREGLSEVTKYLQAGANPACAHKGTSNRFWQALKMRNFEVAHYFIETPGFTHLLQQPSIQQHLTPLQYCLNKSRYGRHSVLLNTDGYYTVAWRMLTEAPLNMQCEGQSFVIAVKKQFHKLALAMLRQGVNVNHVSECTCALHAALKNQDAKMIELLRPFSPQVYSGDYYRWGLMEPTAHAALPYLPAFMALVKDDATHLNVRNVRQETPLMLAVSRGHIAAFLELLPKFTPMKVEAMRDTMGNTLLHLAVMDTDINVDVVVMLIEKAPRLRNIPNSLGYYPWHYASDLDLSHIEHLLKIGI